MCRLQTQESYVLVRAKAGADVVALRDALQSRLPNVSVLTRAQFKASIAHYVFIEQPIGITLATSIFVAMLVGFLVVGLMMFSAVVDNLREFGTLKAIGATTFDLVRLLWTQALVYGVLGTFIGLSLATQLVKCCTQTNARPADPTWTDDRDLVLFRVDLPRRVVLRKRRRIRSLEPGMVFR